MRTWMIPWLFPAGIIVLLVLLAVAPAWLFVLVGVAVIFVAAPLVYRVYGREHPDRRLPGWLPGGRPPR